MKDKLTESLHEDIADLQARKRLLSREVSSLSAVRAAGRHVFRRGAAMMLLRRRARHGPATAGGVGTHGDPMRWLFVAGARAPEARDKLARHGTAGNPQPTICGALPVQPLPQPPAAVRRPLRPFGRPF
jgi:hypothetical protein